MIGMLHAYSRTNAGDGLLVDLTLERLRRSGHPADDVLLVALDPESFPEVPHRLGVGARGRGLAWELVPAAGRALGLAGSTLVRRPIGRPARALARCEGFVAVGGGYLRAVDGTSSVGVVLNHLPQLALAARRGAPTVYLPQSIGPLRGPAGRLVRLALGRVETVCVRDQWSEAELEGLTGVRRVPDLAVLDVAERWDTIEPGGHDGAVALVARPVGHAAGYEAALLALADDLGQRAVWAVQTAGHPTKSDAVHYDRLGLQAGGGLAEMLSEGRLAAVVSVRLHGALMALAAGVPAVHLAYDRKGPAAFSDLGLDDWCLDVRSLDAATLAGAVQSVLSDPSEYWRCLEKRVPELRQASADLDDLLASHLR
jgi:polysaccharide pyruvyl transferase WcaK-like protein